MGWLTNRIAIALAVGALLAVGPACADDTEQEGDNTETEQDVGTDDVDESADVDDSDAETDTGDDVDEGDPDQEEFDNAEPVECAFPAGDSDCPEGNFGPASYFSEFIIETENEEPDACCFDIDGDGEIDNYIGENVVEAVANIEGFQDVNDNINTAIQSGDLSYLFEASHWVHPEWDQAFRLNVYQGGEISDQGGDPVEGEGKIRVAEDNFGDSGEPLYGFDHAEVRDGVMSAEDGFISISIPGLVEGINAELVNVEVEGYVRQNPEPDLTSGGHFEIHDGKLGGALLRDEFFKSMNRVSYDCECFDTDFEDPDNPDLWTEGVFVHNETTDIWSCMAKEAAPEDCTDEENPLACQTLAYDQLCYVLQGLSDDYDIEIDGEAAYSVGVRFESVPTEIIGIEN